jgi:hypothetical protein
MEQRPFCYSELTEDKYASSSKPAQRLGLLAARAGDRSTLTASLRGDSPPGALQG